MRTLGQQRAQFCLEKLEAIPASLREDFKPFSAGLPAMILQNGFGQTLAFLQAKGKDKHKQGFSIIKSWLVERNIVNDAQQDVAILQQISSMDQKKYLHAQKETLAMLEWLKRYANAELFS
jgi:CRISPR-associated protein Cmr5